MSDPLALLHMEAGAEGLDVSVQADTTHDELSEVTQATVTVTLPAEGRTVLEESAVRREAPLTEVVLDVAEEALGGFRRADSVQALLEGSA